jgi:alpha-acetolactate decarboxylase
VQSGHGAGHANQRSDMRLFRQPGASGQLIGVYSGAALEGVVSHPGERLHVHFADPGVTVSGHVDRYSVAAGAVLKMPVR